ncbi:hypothetical protein [Bordetella petrii]|uniref:hypothetical protein n=1 Tax=Bordetella petrii TaxID=94624 RepID=UPI001E2C85D1|nr:hypothetical protein [Bordetella petrii]MCD0504225.1 hypothetical protein [Bordetella petrii]
MCWRRVAAILWSSFLAAGLGSGLVFALIDPLDVIVLGAWQPSRMGFYTVSFFVLWLIAAAAAALAAWLSPVARPEDDAGRF